MLKRWLHSGIAVFERRYDYDMSYAHEMLRISRRALRIFMQAARLSRFNEGVPVTTWFAAKLATTLSEDCGPCTQLVVKMALEAGVPANAVRAVLEGDEVAMPEEARLGWQFARAVSNRDAGIDALRATIAARWGQQAVVSLGLVIAGARLYPTVKYAMGHAQSCRKIRVGDLDIAPHAATWVRPAA